MRHCDYLTASARIKTPISIDLVPNKSGIRTFHALLRIDSFRTFPSRNAHGVAMKSTRVQLKVDFMPFLKHQSLIAWCVSNLSFM